MCCVDMNNHCSKNLLAVFAEITSKKNYPEKDINRYKFAIGNFLFRSMLGNQFEFFVPGFAVFAGERLLQKFIQGNLQ